MTVRITHAVLKLKPRWQGEPRTQAHSTSSSIMYTRARLYTDCYTLAEFLGKVEAASCFCFSFLFELPVASMSSTAYSA